MTAFTKAIMMILSETIGLRDVKTLTEEERKNEFRCPYCHVRVYPAFPREGEPYFSARGVKKHKRGCEYFREDLFRRVAHIDHTGEDVDLEALMARFRHSDRRTPKDKDDSDDADFEFGKEDGAAAKKDPRILRVAVHPRTLVQLYGILEDPNVEEYAGQEVKDLIVDARTIHYHRARNLNQIALVVGGRCYPPKELVERLKSDDTVHNYLCLRAPYPCLEGEKELYYILQFSSRAELSKAYDMMKNKPSARKFLAMAKWTSYFSAETFVGYLGKLPSSGAFHVLTQQNDCDE